MCGHAGMVRLRGDTFPVTEDLNIFNNLFLTSQLRGVHSSGVTGLWRQRPKNVKNARKILQGLCTYKDTTNPNDAFSQLNRIVNKRSQKREKTHERAYYQMLMAHSRHATIGSIGADNAHPFSFHNNRFVGAHNGTIQNAEYVFNKLTETEKPIKGTLGTDKEYGDSSTPYTDSERVLYCIYRWGIDKVYPLIVGAWAFVWYNQSTGSTYFIRNAQRPLHYYYCAKRDSLHYSSEYCMLKFAVERETRDIQKNYGYFCVDTLYSINLNAKKYILSSATDFPWCSVEKVSRALPFTPTPLRKKATRMIYANTADLGGRKKTKPLLQLCYNKEKNRSIHFTVDHDIDEPIEDGDGEQHCLWCTDELPKDKETMVVEMAGVVCSTCYNDLVQVEQIIDCYRQCSDSPLWMRQWIELSEQDNNKGNVYV